ncbi:GNAT family N-acetyltransferase [Paenibacillus larvae]|uniref:GNAT family N-acetyltransferase n=1 Tax=Paenibacillus larvae TaxID=1464 RepID=UPI002282BE9E|nr:GNAT family N-acetyltransferase [Paenibacillus larvae]MCY9510970.1 GNAT family N-acetyltransferase [Paenibacillus larvae]MCY9524281.1 GNAT family N-acetyltransferase [Paenibacillus larvae]
MSLLVISPHPSSDPYPFELLLDADPSEQRVRNYLSRGKCWTAKLDGSTVGVYVLLPTRPDTLELVNVAVAPDFQGQGIGKKLVLHAIETASKKGVASLEVGTGNSGVHQLALYQKCGFRITHVDLDFFTRHYPEPIFENGIQCRDMIRMSIHFSHDR